MGLVGLAHASSHFFHLVLPPLFPILKQEFDVSYAQLGLLPGLFFAASGVMQIISGFLVDQFGARRVLLAGLVLLSISMLLCGLVSEFWMLIPLAVVGGIGNSVFHPADLAPLLATHWIDKTKFDYGEFRLRSGWSAQQMQQLESAAWNTRAVYSIAKSFYAVDAPLVELTRRLLRERPTRLTMLYVRGPDPIQHVGWNLVEPDRYFHAPANLERDRGLVEGVYRTVS